MTILALSAYIDNYIWIIINEAVTHLYASIPGDAQPVLEYAKKNQVSLSNILITHHHDDHTHGIAELVKAFPNAKVYGPNDSRVPLIHYIVRDEDIIHIEKHSFRVLSIPGHTSTHICYQEPSQGWLFCGDTLFSAGCGRVFDGTIEALY